MSTGPLAAGSAGVLAARAAACTRDLLRCAAAYPELFGADEFASVCAQVANANVFAAPRHDAERLRSGCRMSLWIFALDWLIDREATRRSQVTALVAECEDVADGASPGTALGRFFAEIRDELRAKPASDELRRAWRAELRGMLAAMAREWDWKQALPESGPPTLDAYLDNAANFASTFVNVCHWISTGEPDRHLAELLAASDAVQRTLRLANDIATHWRDRSWGDLNALMLGARETVLARMLSQRDTCRSALTELAGTCPGAADDLRGQLDWTWAFYLDGADFWNAVAAP